MEDVGSDQPKHPSLDHLVFALFSPIRFKHQVVDFVQSNAFTNFYCSQGTKRVNCFPKTIQLAVRRIRAGSFTSVFNQLSHGKSGWLPDIDG